MSSLRKPSLPDCDMTGVRGDCHVLAGLSLEQSLGRSRLFRTFLAAGLLLVCFPTVLCGDVPSDPVELHWKSTGKLANTKISQISVDQDGIRAIRFRLINGGISEEVQIVAPTKPSLLHYDYEATLQFHSGSSGVRFGLVVIFPFQMDPRTRRPLEMILPGDSSVESDRWQTLKVKATRKDFESRLRLLRASLNMPNLNTQQAVITGLVVIIEATPGETFCDLGPAVPGSAIRLPDSLISQVSLAGESSETDEPRRFIPIDVELGGLMLDEKPAILRFAPDHGEEVEAFRKMGLNAVWISDCEDSERALQLYDSRVAVLATPPHPEFEPGDFSRVIQALPPLDQRCPHVSAWYQGSRISPEEQGRLRAVSREVRSADRKYQRLQMADVTGSEGAVAREIDLVGIGRHVVGRDVTFGALRNLLIRRQQNAGQLSFPWTWVQTEPSDTQQSWRHGLGFRPQFVEPEQIQQGVYSALSAGYKGIGFWKTRPLDENNPNDRETAIAIELACLEIELLESFLARGRMEGYLTLQAASREESSKAGRGNSRLNAAIGGRKVGVSGLDPEGPSTHDAAVITGGGNTLILATAWDRISQFVPGPMFESEVDLVVASSETASAWQISTTGVYGLPREVTAGGLPVRIKNFSQSAAVIVTSNPSVVIPQLRNQIHMMAPRAAALMTEMASLKYRRVLETVELLRDEHTVPAGVDGWMSQARQMLDRAEFELGSKDYHEASLRSDDAMVFMRQAQHACWKDAVRDLTTASSSPHAVSFSTLPDHWRLMHYIEQQGHRMGENLLASGSFDQLRSLSQAGWNHSVPLKTSYSATADIVKDSRSGQTLRLITWRPDGSLQDAGSDHVMPLTITSAPVEAMPGDIMVVTGRVRRGRASAVDARRPLLIYDSELGPENSVRPELESEWTQFEMIRPVGTSGPFAITLALIGQSEVEEVYLDDLAVRRIPAMASPGNIQFTGAQKESTDSSPPETAN